MNKLARLFAVAAFAACVTTVRAAIITVNTEDNTDFSAGKTNLVTAIDSLQDGDTINFNIPGAGPHYLVTPALGTLGNGGYPNIARNNVTIDGYSQPGSAPNSNTILASNNAAIKIILDSRAGGCTTNFIDGEFGTDESGVLFIVGATNIHIRGLGFLGPGIGGEVEDDPSRYAIAIGSSLPGGAVTNEATDIHISGCWFGLDPGNGTNVYRFKDGVAAFRGYSNTKFPRRITVGVAKETATAAEARAQHNIIVGEFIPAIIEGPATRISGNRFNVYPDGNTEYNINGTDPHDIEAVIEIGRDTGNTVIGTDGDGNTDAEERNLFGGLTAADDDQILEWYGGNRTNMVIAGNYFGVGADGVTRFTNSLKVLGGFNNTTTAQFGSDFDGVSDDIEGNVIFMNNPFADLFPTPTIVGEPIFATLDVGARASFRGNKWVNNNLVPYSYADGGGFRLTSFMNYSAPYMSTSGDIIPVLSTNSSSTRLIGTCAVGVEPYTNIIIDVYQLDPEGWANGKVFNLQELFTPDFQSYYGFPQGRKYLGSFVDNGPFDSDPVVGSFSLDISALQAGAGPVTVTANYSADPPGTHNGRTHTSNFSNPLLAISTIATGGRAVSLSWGGGIGTYLLQKKSNVTDPTWQNVLTSQRETEAVALQESASFFRLADNVTNTVTPLTAFLSGDGERPQVTTGATGLGSFALEGNTLTYYITFSGLSAPATAAHIHGPTNTTGSIGVIIPFSNVPSATSGTISGSVVVSDQNKSNLLSGLTYANIHDANNQGGEIRGQIGPTQLRASLNGANEQPTPVVTGGAGAGTLTRIGNQFFFNITYTGLSSPATAAHIHGRADTSGSAGVLMALPTPSGTSGTISGSLTLDNATLSAIVDGLSYVNIHTEINTGGEIRGQITP